MKFLICNILPHDWKYNFPSIPNKRICTRCGKREHKNLQTLVWENGFDDLRTDVQLIDKWI